MAELPLVLAGPVLRRVDSGRVCVWIALSKPGEVTVTVFTGRVKSTGNGTADGPSIGTRTRPTRRCGVNLHVVVVDVEVAGMPPLSRHSYDVVVDAGGETKGLRSLGMLKDATTGTPKALRLGYADDFLPGFVTAAADIDDLRLAHSSCRKSNGPGPDALAWLDDRVEEGLDDLDKAPQQLFLTGDQIYADDLGGVLLPMLADLAKDMVGTEQLPVGGSNLDATYDRFPALRRPERRTRARPPDDDGRRQPPADVRRVRGDVLRRLQPDRLADAPGPRQPVHPAGPRRDADPPDRLRGVLRFHRRVEGEEAHRGQRRGHPGRAVARRRPQGGAGAGQRADVHDLRRPRDHRRLEHLREVATPGRRRHRSVGRSCATD